MTHVAIGLSLDRSFSSGVGVGEGTALESLPQHPCRSLFLPFGKILRTRYAIVSLCLNAWLAVQILLENSSPTQSAIAADCSIFDEFFDIGAQVF